MPSSRGQHLLGVNQTTTASLSMVIIASIIGGTSDIGWEVLTQIRKANLGESLLAGMAIALMTMLIDRVAAGLAARSARRDADKKGFAHRYRHWIRAAAGAAVLWGLAQTLEFPNECPRALGVGTLIGLFFIVVTGTWPEAMLSVYLCGVAVALSFSLGTTIGICAAHNDTVSAIVRPSTTRSRPCRSS